ncbi:MAG TPA: OmpA family protein [Acidobacteriota bacterium]|nr:OmpA family protein [Acidobacteriota bacterium]
MRRTLVLVATLALVSLTSTAAFAQAKNDPTQEGSTGLFTVARASVLDAGKWSLGVFFDRIAREEGDSVITSYGLSGAYGLTERVEVFFGVTPRIDVDRRFTSEAALLDMHLIPAGGGLYFLPPLCCSALNNHPFAAQRDQNGFGDIWMGLKVKVAGELGEYSGVAVQGMFKLPTSAAADGIGTGAFSVGGKLIGSTALGRLGVNAYGGYLWHDTPDPADKITTAVGRNVTGAPLTAPEVVFPTAFNFEVSPEVLYGVGLQFPTDGQLQAIAEWTGVAATKRSTESDFMGYADQSVYRLGLRAALDSGLSLNAAANYQSQVNVRDISWQIDPDAIDGALRRWGLLFGLAYTNGEGRSASEAEARRLAEEEARRLAEEEARRLAEEAARNYPPTLDCEIERSTVRQGESVRVRAVTSDPNDDPVTVTWNSAAGRLSATTGDVVTWNSSGVPAGSGNITGSASDGRGGTANCTVRVTVGVPEMPDLTPEERPFDCYDFSSGSARIDNRCKAVLDDVALLLRQNPSATVAITGYSDAAGAATANDELSQQRADNARADLVDRHSIGASRIRTSSRGSSEQIADASTAAGRARNRRIHIVVTIPPR